MAPEPEEEVIGPIMAGFGSIAGGIMQQAGAEVQNARALERMREQMAFEERMSNTAYQRATADMKAAGLNPMLMFGHGAAASTPNVSQAPVVNTMQGLGVSMGEAVRLANETRMASAQQAKTESETALNKAALGPGGEVAARINELVARKGLNEASAKSVLEDIPRKEALNVALRELVDLGKKAVSETKREDQAPFEQQLQRLLDFFLGDPGKRTEDRAKAARDRMDRGRQYQPNRGALELGNEGRIGY